MSNFRKAIARISALVLVFACMASLVIPAHAEEEVIPVTEVNLNIPKNIIMRDDVPEGHNQDSWFYFSVFPENHTESLSFNVIDGDDTIDLVVNSDSITIIPKRGGHATIRVSSPSGFSKDYTFNVLEGNYANGIRKTQFDYGRSVGETLNIKDIINENLYSYNSTSDNPDFNEELNHLNFSVVQSENVISLDENSGLVTCLSEGTGTISTQIACGDYINFNITVTNSDVGNITFDSSEKSFSMNMDCIDMQYYLRSVPEEATAKINWNEVVWTSSNLEVLSNENTNHSSYFNFVGEGSTTISATYRNYSASMNVKVVDAENNMQFKNSTLTLSVGESETIEYELGRNNEIVSRTIEGGEDCIQLNGDIVTAVANGLATIKYVDLFGNENYIAVSVSPKPEFISFPQEEYVFTIRPDDENPSSVEYNSYRYINANLQPNDSDFPIKYSIIEGDCISFPYGKYSGTIQLNHTGTALMKAETDNGLAATAKVTVKQGTYAYSYNSADTTVQMKPGEKLDLKEEVRKRLISGTNSDDFTDELNELKFEKSYDQKKYKISDDGIFQAGSAGNYYVYFMLANGDNCSLNMVVSDRDISMIRFERDEFWFNVNTQDYMNNYLKSVPSYMQNTMNIMDIHWSSSNPEIADFGIENGQLYGKGVEGTTEITAEYKGLTAKTKVHFIDAESKFSPDSDDNNWWSMDIKLKPGEKTQLKYIIGKNNYVVSKDISNSECVKFDPDTDTVEATGTGNAIVTYTDRFHNQIQFYITVQGEKVTLTDFKLWGDVTVTIRPGEEGKSYYVNYDTKPIFSNDESKITWEIEGDASILEEIENKYSSYFYFRPLKAGKVTLRGTTENGLTDTCKITILEGNYISAFRNYEDRYSIKNGESLSLADIAVKNVIPENQDISDERLSYSIKEGDDVVSIDKNGLLKSKKEGKAIVRISTIGGQYIDVCIAVTSGLKAISFDQDYYSVPWKLNNGMNNLDISMKLKTDPSYAIAGIDANDIKFTASDGYELQNVSQYGSDISISANIYYPDDFTVTAEYKGIKCNATVHVYEEKEQTELTLSKSATVKNGFMTAIPYSFGKEEKTDCNLEILGNSNSVSLNSSRANGGVFTVSALKKGSTKIRVSSVDNPDLYKDIMIHVKDNIQPDWTFTLTNNDEEIRPDSTGTFILKYGQIYSYEFTSDSVPNSNFAVYPKIAESGALGTEGGAAGGLIDGIKMFAEYSRSSAGKTGSYKVDLWPGASLKFRIVSDFDKAESGFARVHNNTGDNVELSEEQLEDMQIQLTEELPDKITKKSLNTSVEAISEGSDDLIGISETAKVQLNTDTSVSVSDDGKKMIYDITPSISVRACEGSNGRTIGEKKADIDKSVELTLPVGNFVDKTKPVYVTHIKEDGTKYLYEGTYNEEDKTVTFTDEHGFSTFEITQEKDSIPSDVIKPDIKGPDNNESKVTDKKQAVDTSDHINAGTYAGIAIVSIMVAILAVLLKRKNA